MNGFQPFEKIIYDGAVLAFGDPIFIGVVFIGGVIGIALMSNMRLDGKMLLLVPALLLALSFIPMLALLLGIFFGVLVYMALLRVTSR